MENEEYLIKVLGGYDFFGNRQSISFVNSEAQGVRIILQNTEQLKKFQGGYIKKADAKKLFEFLKTYLERPDYESK